MQALVCQNCGAPLEQALGITVCPYCGSRFITESLPGQACKTSESGFQIQGGTLIKYIGCGLSPIIPDGVSYIGKRAFAGSAIVAVTIPSSVVEIQQYAFADCTELASVTIPSSVQRIQNRAFFHCWKLFNISILGHPELGENVFSGTGFLVAQMRCSHNAIDEGLSDQLMKIRARNGRCPYCGKKTWGMLSPVCRKCRIKFPDNK